MSAVDKNAYTALTKLSSLLVNLKKFVELWLLTDQSQQNQDSVDQIQQACVDILLHGLRMQMLEKNNLNTESNSPNAHKLMPDVDALNKLIDDFEWIKRSTQIRDSITDADISVISTLSQHSYSAQQNAMSKPRNVNNFINLWVIHALSSNCLCASLQSLTTEKDLLEYYYDDNAFLRNESYATSMFICLSAFELNQYSLLSQIETNLYSSDMLRPIKHKRTSSHPNFSISPPKRSLSMPQQQKVNTLLETSLQKLPTTKNQFQTVLKSYRRTKSLPLIQPALLKSYAKSTANLRPRSRTINASLVLPYKDTNTATYTKNKVFSSKTLKTLHSNANCSCDYVEPSTSVSSKQSNFSNLTEISKLLTESSSSNSVSSINSTNPTQSIELIKCDDIKIWTDQSMALKKQQPMNTPTRSIDIKQLKNCSPINSFLSNLFTTPPTYTSWSINQNTNLNQEDIAAVKQSNISNINTTNSNSVLNTFLPIYGKKLRSRKTQNFFEDGISTLDYSLPTTNYNSNARVSNINSNSEVIPTNFQSLTTFLQISQFSRNSTELEKENAHFRISEAIITAIEHIKWSKLERCEQSTAEETPAATNWIKNGVTQTCSQSTSNRTNIIDVDEHIPYAEVGENCLDLLSAEVVGLSLISKFNDAHMPKVSELKWLVSDKDTPQNLLPMPSENSITTQEENMLPARMRGTKYWAPPRQQIIFTDHPQLTRKEQISKQNNRCAGCGMYVAPTYMHSFRYCTYLGKYHCTGCHRNQISVIPAKILHMWDFKCYPVSVFAYRLLEQMHMFPLFYVPDLNAALYMQSKVLLEARQKRVQLCYVKDFIKTCRFALKENNFFNDIPQHIASDPDLWSIADFVDANNSSIKRSINELLANCEKHIFNCVLCSGRGFICEYCRKNQVIYPWQEKTFRCDLCGSCFHIYCWKIMLEQCGRCQRMNKRRNNIEN